MATSPKKKRSPERVDPLREEPRPALRRDGSTGLRAAPKRAVVDIVPRSKAPVRKEERPARAEVPPREEKKKEEKARTAPAARAEGRAAAAPPPSATPAPLPEFLSHPRSQTPPPPPAGTRAVHKPARPRRRGRALLVSMLIFAVLVGGGALLVTSVLPRATVTLDLTRTPVSFSEQVRVDTKATAVQVESGRIVLPGELLTARKNVELTFPASGTRHVETKATGKLILWNAYSSRSQVFVAGTRVESPDGKLFRLDRRVTVPAAKVEGGEIIPSKIEVAVTADGAGEAWNVPAAKDWRLPGLKGSPRYEGFYGESVAAMAGGFVGERASPTEADLAAARANMRETLRDALEGQLLVALSEEFRVLEGTEQFKVVGEEVHTDGQDPKFFSLFGDAELRELVFVESMLREAIAERAARAISYPAATEDFQLTYGAPQVEQNALAMNFTAEGSLVLIPGFDAERFRESMLGKDESTLKASVLSLPGVRVSEVSLWPFWVRTVPMAPGKMEIVVE